VTERNWVWVSSRESRKAGKVSVLAVVETVASVALYWWIAVRFDTAALLVASPFVAMLVLFRSPESVARGISSLETFLNWAVLTKGQRLLTFAILLVVLLAILTSSIFQSDLVFQRWGWANSLSVFAMMVLLTCFLIPFVGYNEKMIVFGWPLALTAGPVLAVISSDWSFVVGETTFGTAFKWIGYCVLAVFCSFFASGLVIFATTVFIRIEAVLRSFRPGFQLFSENWTRSLFSEDTLKIPEIIPGLPPGHVATVGVFFKEVAEDFGRGRKVQAVIKTVCFAPIFYLPNILFRITLKSTAWLYLPLIWIAHVPSHLRSEEGRKVWVGYQGRRILDWLAFGTAIATLGAAAALAFNAVDFAALRTATAGEPQLGANILLALDPSRLNLWHWVTLPAAGLTVAITLWMDHLRKLQAAGGAVAPDGPQVRALVTLARIRSFLAILWIIITFVTVTRTAWLLGKLPNWMEPMVTAVILPLSDLWL